MHLPLSIAAPAAGDSPLLEVRSRWIMSRGVLRLSLLITTWQQQPQTTAQEQQRHSSSRASHITYLVTRVPDRFNAQTAVHCQPDKEVFV